MARPDLLWCLAFYAGYRTVPSNALFAYAWCGLARDIVLGPVIGSASFAYVAAGWVTLYWRPIAYIRGWPAHWIIAASGAFTAALIKHGLDYGRLAVDNWSEIVLLSLGDGLLTLAVYGPAVLVMNMSSFRPWRERSGFR